MDESVVEMGNRMAELMNQKDSLKLQLDGIQTEIKSISEVLCKRMRAEDIDKFSSSYGTVYINTSTRARVVDSDIAFEWLRSNGNEGLIKETVNARSLSSVVKAMIEEGKMLLSDLDAKGISCFIDEQARILGRKDNE